MQRHTMKASITYEQALFYNQLASYCDTQTQYTLVAYGKYWPITNQGEYGWFAKKERFNRDFFSWHEKKNKKFIVVY